MQVEYRLRLVRREQAGRREREGRKFDVGFSDFSWMAAYHEHGAIDNLGSLSIRLLWSQHNEHCSLMESHWHRALVLVAGTLAFHHWRAASVWKYVINHVRKFRKTCSHVKQGTDVIVWQIIVSLIILTAFAIEIHNSHSSCNWSMLDQ